jgi:hypothetical protein
MHKKLQVLHISMELVVSFARLLERHIEDVQSIIRQKENCTELIRSKEKLNTDK